MSERKEPDSPPVESVNSSEEDLPAVRGRVPYKVWLVQGLYFLERAAFYGLSQPLQNYLQLSPDDPIRPGALGLGQARAVLIIYIWFVYSYSTPLIGGLLADCWLGRRKTIQVGFLIYVLGLSIVTATAFTQRIYGTGGLPGFIVGMLLVGAGTGTVKPNITVFLIDQFPEEEPKVVTLKNGKSAMVSRELTIQFIWNANYWMINVGGLCGIITTNVERYAYAGFGFAFLICLCLIVTSATIFQAGYTKFETAPPSGNAIADLFGALRRRRNPAHPRPDQTEVEVQSSVQEDSPASPSNDAAIIADAKSALRACLVFLPFPALMLSINLMDSTLIAQAGTMQTNGLPNDIMYNLNPISVMVFLPFFQSWIYPTLAKKKINFSPEHRIGVGLFCATLAIAYATGIQHLIYATGPCFSRPLKCLPGNIPNDVSVGFQTPTYVFLGWAEILAIVAGTQLAYSRAPASMKSIVQALFNLFSALGSLLGGGVSFAAYDPNMVIVYGSITGLLLFVTLGFELSYFVRRKRSN
ncbi:POT family-domain-containing protein [Aspergillus caelatus]|uniref:POT family-domain-containing protein n=2 Tax=Aspergillus subgen. Circumdati TaxID=2720871 RepID=A0A5N7A489_9EURO|nr:POT family-domain-containing protein [Aspergillus caelatus]KAE8364009.1 POT family-domain-containing protein [Aspergillus caelatus]KAE8419882.1 POT family-domain-containing protein [Aspergillus pseudocaelatus]